jgi:hypothetical protein
MKYQAVTRHVLMMNPKHAAVEMVLASPTLLHHMCGLCTSFILDLAGSSRSWDSNGREAGVPGAVRLKIVARLRCSFWQKPVHMQSCDWGQCYDVAHH